MARLSACLDGPPERPIAVGFSGGGDSLALLALACEWASAHGRRVLALTVDHRLNPASEDWTRRAGTMAVHLGAQWKPLVWRGAQAGPAVQERARKARHALLADAAREAGASVILLGHTATDAAENVLMRAQGIPVGSLRPVSVSPVWPQGRGLTLMRPLLGEGREALRHWLRERRLEWIDDPANEDAGYARVRARQALTEALPAEPPPQPLLLPDPGADADFGLFDFARCDISPRGLAIALLCASGSEVPPRGERLTALYDRIAAQEDGTAVLTGARVEMSEARVRIFREPGELRRSGVQALPLASGETAVWDGRFEVCAREQGWEVVAADGHLARLSDGHRKRLKRLPAAMRAACPVLHNRLTGQYVLSDPAVDVAGLCGRRYRATALILADETPQECKLFDLWHGETGSTALFSY